MYNRNNDLIDFVSRFSNNAILPQLYDDSLSFNELQYRLVFSINEIIKRVNEITKTLNKIDIETGKVTLDFNSINYPVNINSFNRIFRDILEANERNGSGVSDATYDAAFYSYLNSATKIYYQGIEYYICIYGCLNMSHFNFDNKHILKIYNRNGEVVSTKTLGNIGIAKSVTADNTYIYVTYSSSYNTDNVAVASRNIARIKLTEIFSNTNNVQIEVKTIPSGLIGNVRVDCCSYFKDSLYILTSAKRIYKYDFNENATTPIVVDIPYLNYNDLCVTELYYYLILDNSIILIDKKTNVIKKYILDDIQNLGIYKMGELVSADIDEKGYTTIFTAMHTYKQHTNQFDLMQVFEQNIFNNDITCTNLDNYTNAYGYQGSKDLIVHCSKQSKSNNPNGTVGKEFKHIAEAVVFCGYQNKYETLCEIILDKFDDSPYHKNTYYDEYVDLNFPSKSFKIVASDLTNAVEHQYGIGGISCNCGYVYIHGLRILNSLPKSDMQYWKYCCYLKNCTADIFDCNFPNNNVAYIVIYARRCFLNYTISNGPSTSYAYWMGLPPVTYDGQSLKRIWGLNIGCTVNAHGSVWNGGVDNSVINFEQPS